MWRERERKERDGEKDEDGEKKERRWGWREEGRRNQVHLLLNFFSSTTCWFFLIPVWIVCFSFIIIILIPLIFALSNGSHFILYSSFFFFSLFLSLFFPLSLSLSLSFSLLLRNFFLLIFSLDCYCYDDPVQNLVW